MTITNLGSFVNFTCKISAKNRVSKVAERNHGVKGNFILVNLRTNGTGKLSILISTINCRIMLLGITLDTGNEQTVIYHVIALKGRFIAIQPYLDRLYQGNQFLTDSFFQKIENPFFKRRKIKHNNSSAPK